MPEETIVLRDVARQLALIKNKKAKGIDTAKLHSLLRAGGLKAGFYILDGSFWLDIPLAHWLKTDTQSLRDKLNKHGGGSYKVKLAQFPDQVARIIFESFNRSESGSEESSAMSRLIELVSSTGRSYEVTIKKIDFEGYLQRHNITMPNVSVPVGRRPKESWPRLCGYVGAYFGAHYRDQPGVRIPIESASKEIIDSAKADGIPDLPDWATLKDHISKATHLINEDAFKLKK